MENSKPGEEEHLKILFTVKELLEVYGFLGRECVLLRVIIGVMKYYDHLQGWDLFGLPFHTTVHPQRKSGKGLKQGGNLEARVAAEAIWECCLLAWPSWLPQPAFL